MLPREAIRDYASDLRPDTWGEVCGQQAIVDCLRRYCVSARPPKAILLIGSYGAGKSSLCRLTAMSMACSGRPDDDPDPCGHCESCRSFAGSFSSMDTMVIGPQTPTAQFKDAVLAARSFAAPSVFSEEGRPVPVYVDDLDEHPREHQRHLKRELDSSWCGFILATTTSPEKIEEGLLDRFMRLYLQPPDMSDLIPWIERIGRIVGIGAVSPDAAAAVARNGGMTYRGALKLMQAVESFGLGFTPGAVERAALMVGMRG